MYTATLRCLNNIPVELLLLKKLVICLLLLLYLRLLLRLRLF